MMRNIRSLSPLAVLVILVTCFGISAGQAQDAGEPQRWQNGTSEDAQILREFSEQLQNTDLYEQILMVERALGNDNHHIKRIAMRFALDSNSRDLIYLAIRHWWESRHQTTVDLSLPLSPDEQQREFYQENIPFVLRGLSVASNGDLCTHRCHWRGNLEDGGFKLVYQNCVLSIIEVSSSSFSGSYRCGAGPELPATIYLE